jgi:shikimate dehydrogenase
MMSDRYAVIGNPIAQSRSPEIHRAFAQQTAQPMSYEALLAPLDGFAATVAAFRAAGGKGLNVTTPFKLEAFALATRASARARAAGAVNTLAWRDDAWYGDNTDGVGLVRDLEQNLHCKLEGRAILLLGAGGAARGVLGPLLAARPQSLTITNRTVAKAQELAAAFTAAGPVIAIGFEQVEDRVVDLVIDATSVSLASGTESIAWPPVQMHPGALAYEMAYGKSDTAFRRWAQSCGAHAYSDGLGMLVEQAAESFFIWRGVRPDTAAVLAQLREPPAS